MELFSASNDDGVFILEHIHEFCEFLSDLDPNINVDEVFKSKYHYMETASKLTGYTEKELSFMYDKYQKGYSREQVLDKNFKPDPILVVSDEVSKEVQDKLDYFCTSHYVNI